MGILESNAKWDLDVYVQVEIDKPSPYSGTAWNAGENAGVKVLVTNTGGFTLRDAVLKLSTSPNAFVLNVWVFRAEWYLGEIGPGEARTCFFIVHGSTAGGCDLRADLSAEVVPYATRKPTQRYETIYVS